MAAPPAKRRHMEQSPRQEQSPDLHIYEERLRMRTLSRYFSPAQITADTIRAIGGQPVPPTLSPLPQLTALAQLGPLKLQCDRAFISLLGTASQFIIAEATRTISLRQSDRYRDPKDALFLGVQALHSSYGVCPNTIQLFTDKDGSSALNTHDIVANTSRYVIRDFRTLDLFKDRPYVQGFPYMRSYLEVPLTAYNGRVIGSYCVVDNVLRDDFFDDDSVYVMSEIARSIADYLDAESQQNSRARGERLMEGLSLFTDGKSGFDPGSKGRPHRNRQAWSYSSDKPFRSQSINESTCSSVESATMTSTLHGSSSAGTPGLELGREETSATTAPSERSGSQQGNIDTLNPDHADMEETDRAPVVVVTASDVVPTPDTIFSRAAAIICESLSMDGTVFLSATGALDSAKSSANQSNRRASRVGSKIQQHPEGCVDQSSRCQTLGSSIAMESSTYAPSGVPMNLDVSFMAGLAHTFPSGQVFSVDEYGTIPDDSETIASNDSGPSFYNSRLSAMSSELQSAFSTARSILFLPLKNLSSGTVFAYLLGWSSDPTQYVGNEDLVCLKAFGDAVMTELARSEVDYISRAKSDFISSISHELRSPLHGVLASVELLNNSAFSEADRDIIGMIESCGTTLLDTLNHVLEYSRINRFDGSRSKVEGLALTTNNTTITDVHGNMDTASLSRLVEDVVNVVHVGMVSQQKSTSTTAIPSAKQDSVGVYLNIQHHTTWEMPLHVGAWKRIIMNLFANSLKFTNSGYIEVLLSVVQRKNHQDSDREHIQLVVNDTGIGMSKEYVRKGLFQPFTQENPLQPGTGLGMSLVKQIVDDLGGNITIESSLGFGTHIEVLMPLASSSRDWITAAHTTNALDPDGLLRGRTLCLVLPRHEPANLVGSIKGDRATSLTAVFKEAAESWLGMKFVQAKTLLREDADFYIVCGDMQETVSVSGLDRLDPHAHTRVISIGRKDMVPEPGHVTLLDYPVSPTSICKALLAALQKSDRPHSAASGAPSIHTCTIISPADDATARALVDVSKAEQVKAVGTDTSAPANVANPQSHHVLAVDDNPINLKVLVSYLKKLGCSLITATNGLEAVEAFKSSSRAVDVVFMDISMPVMDGFQASRAIRDYELNTLDPSRSSTYIVALTGLGSEASRQEAVASGIDDFRVKPVKLEQIRKLLHRDGP